MHKKLTVQYTCQSSS